MCVCSLAQLFVTLCDPKDCKLPGSPVHGIFQARIQKWVANSYSRGSSQPRDQTHISCVYCVAGRFFTWAIGEALTDERNQTRHKQMERYNMLLLWKSQYCENNCTNQTNLQIHCNTSQITNGVFHRTRTRRFTICMETQKTLKSQSNFEKEKQSWRNEAPWLQTVRQSYSNQNGID